jgi:hypothetical protein
MEVHLASTKVGGCTSWKKGSKAIGQPQRVRLLLAFSLYFYPCTARTDDVLVGGKSGMPHPLIGAQGC